MFWERINWEKWDIINLGRAAGVIIIVLGTIVTTWEVLDEGGGLRSETLRASVYGALSYLSSGGILILIAEIAERLGWLAPFEEEVVEEPGASDASGATQ